MKKELAAAIITAAVKLDEQLGELDHLLSLIDDPGERDSYLSDFKKIMSLIGVKIIIRIEREYPDLNPDQE